MKGNTKMERSKKLKLSRTTIKNLTSASLLGVAGAFRAGGGGVTMTVGQVCCCDSINVCAASEGYTGCPECGKLPV
jgi:hypothetical protein